MATETIHIQAKVGASPAITWQHYTDPAHIVHWNFASDDWMCPSAENDLRPGGKYIARMEAKDGSFGFDFEAIYHAVIPDVMLQYTMGDGRKATVVFTPADGGTEVQIAFEAETENGIELQRAGWQAILDNFKKYTEAQV
jgi:uncharacterized protein YndB with AHSA1/START domain